MNITKISIAAVLSMAIVFLCIIHTGVAVQASTTDGKSTSSVSGSSSGTSSSTASKNTNTSSASSTSSTSSNATYKGKLTATLNYTVHKYTAKFIKPTMTVKVGNHVLKKSEYSVKYSNNKSMGTAKIIISYGGKSITKYFKIVPKTAQTPKLTQRKQNQFSVTLREDLTVTGYQIKYSKYPAADKYATVTVKNGESLTKCIQKVENNRRYYVWVRNYKTVGKSKYYGSWSKRTSVYVTKNSADASLPDEMLDSYVVEAMKYLGYKTENQKKAGSLLEDRASGPRTPQKYLTSITYGGGSTGREAVKNKNTATGYAPNVTHFNRNGLVCASFVTYYYDNFLRNIGGVNTDYIRSAMNKTGYAPYSCMSWYNAMPSLVKSGKATLVDKVKSYQSLPAANLKKLKVGDLVMFSVPSTGTACGHVAVYAGTNHEGDHFVAHVGGDEGPVFQTLERFENVVNEYHGCAYSAVYRFKDLPTSRYDYKITLKNYTYTFKGNAVKPAPTVRDAAGKIIDKKNYTLYYYNCSKKGTATVKAVFKNGYVGTKSVNYKIK